MREEQIEEFACRITEQLESEDLLTISKTLLLTYLHGCRSPLRTSEAADDADTQRVEAAWQQIVQVIDQAVEKLQ
jgi:hypothetical protein